MYSNREETKVAKYTICFDTVCTGYSPVMQDEKPITFNTEAEAEKEIASDPEFYADCFVCPISQIGHKMIFTGKEKRS